MVDYLYDGSFNGFLTCVYLHYYEEKAAGIYPAGAYQGSLLREARPVETSGEKAARVYRAIEEKIGNAALERVYKVFLSSVPEKENAALQYLRLGFRIGGKLSSLHGHPVVLAAQQAARKVDWEVDRITGILRFSVLAAPASTLGAEVSAGPGVGPPLHGEASSSVPTSVSGPDRELLYSRIEPVHDILELLGDHFADRFREDPFIIHDPPRGKALFGLKGSWYVGPLREEDLPPLSRGEKEYRRLWQSYFRNIAIKERTNPRCQRQFIPSRYWKNLTEMQGGFSPEETGYYP
ncbi:MAG: TIGR03915 family putative DNA repair protein [Bacillota bacterium]|nr:TIGR03915 family putative DNA repair protein [Bacillota bacterium]